MLGTNEARYIKSGVLWRKLDLGGTTSAAVAASAEPALGAAAAQHWVAMKNYRVCHFFVELDTTSYFYQDDVATVVIQQATSAVGAGAKTLKTFTPSATLGLLDSAGKEAVFTVTAGQLDVDNGFTYVRPLVSITDNNGVDLVSCTYVLTQPRYGELDETGSAPVGRVTPDEQDYTV